MSGRTAQPAGATDAAYGPLDFTNRKSRPESCNHTPAGPPNTREIRISANFKRPFVAKLHTLNHADSLETTMRHLVTYKNKKFKKKYTRYENNDVSSG